METLDRSKEVQQLEKMASYVSGTIDLAKHLTTLSSGAIVIGAALLEKLSGAHHIAPIKVSIIGFVLSIVFAIMYCVLKQDTQVAIMSLTWSMNDADDPRREEAEKQNTAYFHNSLRNGKWMLKAACFTFVAGIGCLALFVIVNVPDVK